MSSSEKLAILTSTARAFIDSGAINNFKKIEVDLVWTSIEAREGEEYRETVIVPSVKIKLEKE